VLATRRVGQEYCLYPLPIAGLKRPARVRSTNLSAWCGRSRCSPVAMESAPEEATQPGDSGSPVVSEPDGVDHRDQRLSRLGDQGQPVMPAAVRCSAQGFETAGRADDCLRLSTPLDRPARSFARFPHVSSPPPVQHGLLHPFRCWLLTWRLAARMLAAFRSRRCLGPPICPHPQIGQVVCRARYRRGEHRGRPGLPLG
jgi:hypothetical protein